MIVQNLEVALYEDGHWLPGDARDAAFLDWLCSIVAQGDDGRTYWFGCSPLVLAQEGKDLFHFELCVETGDIHQIPGSIYKNFRPVTLHGEYVYPAGSLGVERSDEQVVVTLGSFRLMSEADKTWHDSFEDSAKKIRIEFAHRGAGFPTWYGKEKPSYLTPHSIAYGYYWSGTVEGTLMLDGRMVRLQGRGIRERYIAVDSSTAEIGGWEDWMWLHFDEAFGRLYEDEARQQRYVSQSHERGTVPPCRTIHDRALGVGFPAVAWRLRHDAIPG